MRLIPVLLSEPDMVIAHDIIDSNGRVLLRKDTVLTQNFIDELLRCDINVIYIEDALSKGIEISSPISPALKADAMAAVKSMDLDAAKQVAKKIVDELINNKNLTLDMQDLRCFDDYTFAHSVNVAVVSCTLGIHLNLSNQELEDLVYAGLLHDLGKLSIPTEILEKPGRLSPEEFMLVKTHAKASYDLISDNLSISSYVKNAVLCHHENLDGTGYPNGLSGEQIGKLARILHIADVYDALSSKRPYKNPYPPFTVVEILKDGRGTQFDPELLDTFLTCIPLYPKGNIITLNYSTEAIVVENYGVHNERPLVRLTDGKEIDLSEDVNKDYVITCPSQDEILDILEEEQTREYMIKPVKRSKILVLDEDGATFKNIHDKLDFLFEIKMASSDTQAQGYISHGFTPDIIIIDVDNRNLTNFEDFKTINEKMACLYPLILLGSYRDVSILEKFKKMGIKHYIIKPYHLVYLQTEILKLVN